MKYVSIYCYELSVKTFSCVSSFLLLFQNHSVVVVFVVVVLAAVVADGGGCGQTLPLPHHVWG